MPSNLTRRDFGLVAAGLAATLALPQGAQAMTVDEASALSSQVIGEINSVINSGASESAMYGRFEDIFTRYADVNYIAQTVLGPAGRNASAGQKQAFTAAYKRYLSVKYGKRFREFIGGKIEVKDAHPLKSFVEVVSVAKLQGQAPFEVRWHVFEKGGQRRFFNLIIEGVNMLATERSEVGAMLDKAGGSIDKLTASLKG